MIDRDMEQRTDEWHRARLGKITASRFSDVLTEPRSKADREAGVLSQTAHSYMLELLGERLTGTHSSIGNVPSLAWGIQWEATAKRVYADTTGRQVQEVGFCTHPTIDGVGCSPDGLVGDVGGLELKCPFNPREHLKTVLSGEVPRDYVAQVQGSMWVCQREWWDFVSYDPRLEDPALALVVVRVKRDDQYIGRLERACLRLLEKLEGVLSGFGKRKPVASEAHRVAHLLAPPIALTYHGQVIEEWK